MFDQDFDSQKLMFHPGSLAEWLASGRTRGPLYTEFELTSRCNCRCIFCGVDHQVNMRNDTIDLPLARKIIDGLAAVGNKAVMFCGHGEPLLNPDVIDIVRFSSEMMSVSMTTNGVALTAEKLALLDSLEWIRFSVNGGTPENYAHVHGTGIEVFEQVLANIAAAVARKRKLNLSVTIGTQLVLLPDNAPHVFDLARRLKETGVDYFSIKPYSQHPLSTNRIEINYDDYRVLGNDLDHLQDDTFKIIFRKTAMTRAGSAKAYDRCYGTHFISFVSANGDIWECNVFAGDPRFFLGNGGEDEFVRIWNGERRKKVLDFIDNELKVAECRDLCRMDACNRYLQRLKKPWPHDNFI